MLRSVNADERNASAFQLVEQWPEPGGMFVKNANGFSVITHGMQI